MVAVQAHDELETLREKLSLVKDMRDGDLKDKLLAKLEAKIANVINRDESSGHESEADVLRAAAPEGGPAPAPAPAPAAALGAPPHSLMAAGADLPPLREGEQALRDDGELSGSGFSVGDEEYSLHENEHGGLGFQPGDQEELVENDSGDSVA